MSLKPTDNIENFDTVFGQIRTILSEARTRAWQSVNTEMVTSYWEIGRVIVEEEQKGSARADYGTHLLGELSKRLAVEYGPGWSVPQLRSIRQFYSLFQKRSALRSELTWTHYKIIMRVSNPQARSFYEAESVNARWSTRELERQIDAMLFERLALSRDKEGVKVLAAEGHTIHSPADLVKDPYVLEFTGIPDVAKFSESDLETALTDHLEKFLLELGKGFAFMGRQQRLTIDGDHFYIDLVFYNRLARCFVLIDLKLGKATHQDLGQMQMYVHYYQREMTIEGENPPIGIVLCADKNDAVVRYTLPENNTQIFASRYRLHLPSDEELIATIRAEQERFEMEKRLLEGDNDTK
jgi:predicted nuclease of restriction endonuclease-like (RecB) superfamily